MSVEESTVPERGAWVGITVAALGLVVTVLVLVRGGGYFVPRVAGHAGAIDVPLLALVMGAWLLSSSVLQVLLLVAVLMTGPPTGGESVTMVTVAEPAAGTLGV